MDIDSKLILKCKKYDKSAFIELFKIYEKYLYKLCYGYTQNEQDSLDVVQEIYIKIFRNIEKFDGNMPFHPWVRKLAVNTCLNFKRSIKSNIISLYYENEEGATLEDTLSMEYNLEEEIEKKDLKEVINKYLKDLNENYRIIIILRYFEGLSYNEIAETLGKPLGTVKTDLYRAKSVLKKKLEGVLEA
ncbi:MAG: RNA polymerase sigma factor [Bacillota bacterium]|nr:RNA polymerase sigma factor [Bacillota bacterium]